MNSKFVAALLAASALALPAPAFAQAAPTAQDMAALQAQIQALQAQLNQLQAAQAAQAAQVAHVEQVAAAPVPVPVPPKPPAPGWWGGTTISGKAYFNVSDISQRSTDLSGHTVRSIQDGTETELKRFYVGVDHKFNDVFSANITTDFRYNSGGTSNDVLVYVKKAFVQAKLNPAIAVRVGAADLPWVPFVEGLYGYRFVENTLIDRTKFGTSSDWGVHVLGSFANNLVSYQISAIDGNGYKTLTRNSNTIDLEGRLSVNPIKEITLGIGGYTGKRGKSNDTVDVRHRATRFDAVAAYTNKRVRAGVEYFAAKNWSNITTAPVPLPAPVTPNDNSHGWSAFGSFAFTPQISAFGRYDWVKPTKFAVIGTDGPAKDDYFNLGVDYKPIAPLDFALVYKHERTNDGFLSTSNGNIGGLDHGTYNEIGLFGQLVF